MINNYSKKHFSHFYRKTRLFLVYYLVILIICLIVKFLYTREQIYFAINGLHTYLGDIIFPFFTMLGNGLSVIFLSLIIAIFSFRKSFLLLSGYLATALVAQVLKFIFDKPRPYLYFRTQHHKMYLVKGTEMLSYHSFPSGHTVTAFSACLTLAYLFRYKYFNLPMLIMACCIGYSRIYLSEHFFEDVTAGSVIGVFMTLFWLYWLDNKPFLHTAKWQGGLVRKVK